MISNKKLLRATVSVLSCAILAVELPAQFSIPGIPQIVFDPTSDSDIIRTIAEAQRQLAQLQQTYQLITQQYNQMIYNAKYLTNKNAWIGMANRIVLNPNTANVYGETAAWPAAILHGTGSPTAWQNATIAVLRNRYLSSQPLGTSSDIAHLATVEIADNAATTAVESIGTARNQQDAMDRSIARFETAAYDTSPAMNSEVQQLNLIATGTAQQLRMQQAANNALIGLLEQKTVDNKLRRDQIADSMNFVTRFNQYVATEDPGWASASQALTSYRMR